MITRIGSFLSKTRTVLLGLVIIAIAVWITHKVNYRKEEEKDAIRRIRERGYLLALTDKNSLSYFIYKGEPLGYQLDMLESFSGYLGVPLRIIACDDVSKLYYYLDYNVADVIALNLPISTEGKRLVHYTRILGETRLILLQRKNRTPRFIASLNEFLNSDTVYARASVFMNPYYRSFLKQTIRKPILTEVPGTTQEQLIRKLSEGKIDYLLCPENIAMVFKRYYQDLDASLVVFPLYAFAWGVNHNSDTLLMKLNSWIDSSKSTGEFRKTWLEYYANQKIANSLRNEYVSLFGRSISPYDQTLKKLSSMIWWDWRLLASLVYEESNFKLGVVSSRSASGLMQLMPETAAKMGMDSLSTPAEQLAAGVRYLRHVDKQLPDEISSPLDRIKFTLASYNVGIGRVMQAREKALKFGKDPNRWDGNVEYYLLRRSKKDPYAKADSANDESVDYMTEGFVDDIIGRYWHYRNNIQR